MKQKPLNKHEKKILGYLNKKPALLSLLYDLDLLPEQLQRGTRKWRMMIILTIGFKCGEENANK